MNIKFILSKNGIITSNIITYSLMFKNLRKHSKFCKLNSTGQMLNSTGIKSSYSALKRLLAGNPDLSTQLAIMEDRSITYQQMLFEIENLSKYLHFNLKLNKGENVSICAKSSIEGIIAFFSLNKLGLVNARIFNGSKEDKFQKDLLNFGSKTIFMTYCNLETVKDIIHHTKIENIIMMDRCDPELKRQFKLKNSTVNIIDWNNVQELGSMIKEDYIEQVNEQDIASILYTSGSSGEPKPITIANKVYVNMVDIVTTSTGIKKCVPEKAVGVVSHEYPYAAINSTIMVLLMGKTLILPKDNSENYFDDLLKEQPEKIQAIPNFYKLMENAKRINNLSLSNLKFLKTVVSGGETFLKQEKLKTLQFLREMHSNPLLIDGFGFGEMGSATALKFGLSDYFLLMNGIEAKAVHPDTLEDLPLSNEGLLCLSGPIIADGYYNNDDATKKSFIEDSNGKKWFVSDTYGTVHGRLKRLVKLGGRVREYFITGDQKGNFVKVYAGNVENIIISTGYVEDCVVVPSDTKGLPNPIAYVSLKGDCVISPQELINTINLKCQNLETFAQPTTIKIEDKIKRTRAGKKDYTFYKERQLANSINNNHPC